MQIRPRPTDDDHWSAGKIPDKTLRIGNSSTSAQILPRENQLFCAGLEEELRFISLTLIYKGIKQTRFEGERMKRI